MKVVGTGTKFTTEVKNFIKTGKNENEGKNKPSREQVNNAITEFFTEQRDIANKVIQSLSNERSAG